ncbi:MULTISPECIES: hypothetical protein [Borreliella]|uniref:hypothetical protein n=2 Tax=Borreliella TaxID=64895 RepID=UPI001AEFCEBE|nr:hypothetical protein [Borreliella valaisiana]
MDTFKNINKLLDTVDVKNLLLKDLESSFGNEKMNIVQEGLTLTNSVLKLVFLLKDKIEKNNEERVAAEEIDKRLKQTIDISIEACKAFEESNGDFSEYNKLIKLRGEITKKMLQELEEQIDGDEK